MQFIMFFLFLRLALGKNNTVFLDNHFKNFQVVSGYILFSRVFRQFQGHILETFFPFPATSNEILRHFNTARDRLPFIIQFLPDLDFRQAHPEGQRQQDYATGCPSED